MEERRRLDDALKDQLHYIQSTVLFKDAYFRMNSFGIHGLLRCEFLLSMSCKFFKHFTLHKLNLKVNYFCTMNGDTRETIWSTLYLITVNFVAQHIPQQYLNSSKSTYLCLLLICWMGRCGSVLVFVD